MMEFWIIRRKDNGWFLPEVSGQRAGYTSTEPQEQGVPRLFTTKAGAARALTWWLKGSTTVWRGMQSIGFEGEEYDEQWSTEVEEHRKAEDMEVVMVVLKL